MAEEPKRTERPPTQTRRSDIPPDTILLGKKPIMAYATAVMMHFNTGAKRLTSKARGRAISTAVDVAEVVNNRFFQGGLTKSVALGTEVVGEGQDARNVSTIEVVLERTSNSYLITSSDRDETVLETKNPFFEKFFLIEVRQLLASLLRRIHPGLQSSLCNSSGALLLAK